MNQNFAVSDSSYFRVGQRIKITGGETYVITSIEGDTLTVRKINSKVSILKRIIIMSIITILAASVIWFGIHYGLI